MNWTEGSLARHSRGRQAKEVLLRQKEHFAKARAGLIPSTSKKSPPSISFLHQSTSSPSSRHSRQSQNPASLHARASAGEGQPSSSSRKRGRDTPAPGRDVARLPVLSHYFEPDLDGQQPGSSTTPLDKDAFHEKRRKLLLKGDWVGVGMQKPIPVKFSRDHSESRKWSRHHRSANSKTRHLLGSRYDQMKARRERILATSRAQNVTIRIGSQEVRLGNPPSIDDSGRLAANFTAASANHRFHDEDALLNSTSSLTDPREGRNASRHRVNQSYASSLMSASETSSEPRQKNASCRKRHILTTSPLMLQPVPLRSLQGRLLTLTSFGSDIADSTLAQVGRPSSSIASRKEENELWRQWAGPSESLDATDYLLPGIRETPPQPRISPGISEFNQNLLAQTNYREVALDSMSFSASEHPASAYDVHEHQSNSLSPTPERPVNDWPCETNTSQPTSMVNDLDFRRPALDALGDTECCDLPTENAARVTEGSNLYPGEPLEASKPMDTTQAAGVEAAEDPDSVWMKFVFSDDDSEKLRTAALSQAQEEKSRALQSPNGGDTIEEDSLKEWGRDISMVGTFGCTSNESFDRHDDLASTTKAYGTHNADFGSSSTGLSDLMLDNWEGRLGQSDDIASMNTGTDLETPELNHGRARDGTIRARMGSREMASDAGSLVVEAPKSLVGGADAGESFKFVRPKLFVGKLSVPTVPDHRPRALSPVTMTKRKTRGRPKKRTMDGRANIKSIPVYNGDPIEEFDEGEFGVQAEAEPSLFGELETE